MSWLWLLTHSFLSKYELFRIIRTLFLDFCISNLFQLFIIESWKKKYHIFTILLFLWYFCSNKCILGKHKTRNVQKHLKDPTQNSSGMPENYWKLQTMLRLATAALKYKRLIVALNRSFLNLLNLKDFWIKINMLPFKNNI